MRYPMLLRVIAPKHRAVIKDPFVLRHEMDTIQAFCYIGTLVTPHRQEIFSFEKCEGWFIYSASLAQGELVAVLLIFKRCSVERTPRDYCCKPQVVAIHLILYAERFRTSVQSLFTCNFIVEHWQENIAPW